MLSLFKRVKKYNNAEIRQYYQDIFNTPKGLVVLKHILSIANVDESTFVVGDRDYTILKEGQRRLALNILKMAQDDENKRLDIIMDTEKEKDSYEKI